MTMTSEPLSPLGYGPAIEGGHVVEAWRFGELQALVITEPESTGTVEYTHVVLVFDASGIPVYAVASEVNASVESLGGGSHFLGVFYDSNHGNLGSDDLWADLDAFRNKALALVEERVGHSPEPLDLDDFGHASSEAIDEVPLIEGGDVVQAWGVGEYQALLIVDPKPLTDVVYAHLMLVFNTDGEIVYALAVEVVPDAWGGTVHRFVLFDEDGRQVLEDGELWGELAHFCDQALSQVETYFDRNAEAPN